MVSLRLVILWLVFAGVPDCAAAAAWPCLQEEGGVLPVVTPAGMEPPSASNVPSIPGGMMWGNCLAIFGIAAVLTLLFVPLVKQLAFRIGLVDYPDQKRKLHGEPIPLVGGISIFCITVVTAMGAFFLVPVIRERDDLFSTLDVGLFVSCLVILIIGIIDDRFGMRGRQKLAGQFIVATLLAGFGYQFNSLTALGLTVDLRFYSLLFVYGWILVGINSVNLLDGADGFASTIGMMMSLALCIMAIFMGRNVDAVILAAAAGSILGFLRFNFPPASAYLGDAGSMLIGLFVAAMSIRCVSKQATLYAFLAPLALLAIPLVDTLAAIVRRRLTGRSVFAVDRGHLHHALIRKGFGPRKSLLMFGAMCLFTSIGGILSLVYRQSEYALLSVAAVFVFLFVGKVFGVAEFQLIALRSREFARSFLVIPQKREGKATGELSVRLQGTKDWERIWKSFCEFAREHNLSSISIDLNLPWLHESWYARWQQPGQQPGSGKNRNSPEDLWCIELPLSIDGRNIGRLLAEGVPGRCAAFATFGLLEKVLAGLEPAFRTTIASHAQSLDNSTDESMEMQDALHAEQPVDVPAR